MHLVLVLCRVAIGILVADNLSDKFIFWKSVRSPEFENMVTMLCDSLKNAKQLFLRRRFALFNSLRSSGDRLV